MSVPARLAAITAAAAITLTACGHPAAPVIGRTATPPTCRQQYETWKHGQAANAAKDNFERRLAAVKAAALAQDVPLMVAAFRKLGPAVAAMARSPIPRCADPAGYWALILTRIRAAADNAAAGTGQGSPFLFAIKPLRGLPAIEAKLGAELKRTTGT